MPLSKTLAEQKNMLIEKLEGLKVTLNDNDIAEELLFRDKSVSATIGEKNGAVCSPIFELQIINETSIIIKGQGIEIKWENIKINTNQISTIRNGKESIYNIIENSKLSQHKRRLP